ncbi:DMT family transporter [Companilactobacillus sp. HBUAS59699]|uniref:DMT family transporter n=1 Tax=Companilactobacillus sp. HBUAS59699 TaxID=3109358 RepID=UPI002FF181DF
MVILILIPILIGSGLAIQTAVNSKLREYVGSPYMASTISFTIGALFLIVLTLLSSVDPLIPMDTFAHNPWWIWIGGVLGVIALTVNLLLFPRLGSIQTAVLPLFGQIIMGLIIDQFGLFYAPKSGLTLVKFLSALLVSIGMLMSTGMIGKHLTGDNNNNLSFQLIGIGSGLLMASQAAINGHLGIVLKSSTHAAMISFLVGAILLWILIIILRVPVKQTKVAVQAGKKYWWIWIGGFLGAAYVFGVAWLVPQIGTGQVVVITLFGQLLFSTLIDQFGLFQSFVNKVSVIRIIGLVVMFIGVAGIHFLK